MTNAYTLLVIDTKGEIATEGYQCASRADCITTAYDQYGLRADAWARLGMRVNETTDGGRLRLFIIYPVTGFQPYE